MFEGSTLISISATLTLNPEEGFNYHVVFFKVRD
jgi:hypothetical protein